MREKITKTFTITANESVMKTFENFMCFLHYNGGHSGLFAMSFDGDGSDTFKCSPPPEKIVGEDGYSLSGKCGGIGQGVEIAREDFYCTYDLDRNKNHYLIEKNGTYKVSPNGEIWKKNKENRSWERLEE